MHGKNCKNLMEMVPSLQRKKLLRSCSLETANNKQTLVEVLMQKIGPNKINANAKNETMNEDGIEGAI